MRIVTGMLFAALVAAQTEKPVVLYPGLGIWRHTIATGNAEAQKFFDQGLNLLYGFNRYEALRSFRKASELDPRAAMPYWGIAMAMGPYINMDSDPDGDPKAACEALERGLKLQRVPERERDYLAAAATRCPEYQPKPYIESMKALAARYPDDLDALTFYADSLMLANRWRWYSADGTPAPGQADAERTLEEVLRRWPEHPGANHYYIHAVESSKTPERAIASSQRLMALVPEAGHLVHMPGHIWLVLGDWETAAQVNERAAAVDRHYFASTNVTAGSYSGYYAHNLHFILYARSMQGRKEDTLRAGAELSKAMAPMAAAMAEMMDTFLPVPLLAQVRFGDWAAILKTPRPDDKQPTYTALWHYARALALSAGGDREGAARARAGFEQARAKVPADRIWGTLNKVSDVLAMAGEVLSARFSGSPADAVPHWRNAVAMQDALIYDEPPAWFYPIRESLGAALLRAGQPAEAEAVFREGARRTPRNGRMLFGLLESLRAQNKKEMAELVEREFKAAWRKADIQVRIEEL